MCNKDGMESIVVQNQTDYYDKLFEGSVLAGGELKAIEFFDCHFKKCSFNSASIQQCKFIDCKFEDCDLSLMGVKGSIFRRVSMMNTKAIGVNWSETRVFELMSFEKCVIDSSVFMDMNLNGVRFEKCRSYEVDYSAANLQEAFFSETDLKGSTFLNSDLRKADFRSAINYFISPQDNKLKGAKFSLPEAMNLLHGLDVVLEE